HRTRSPQIFGQIRVVPLPVRSTEEPEVPVEERVAEEEEFGGPEREEGTEGKRARRWLPRVELLVAGGLGRRRRRPPPLPSRCGDEHDPCDRPLQGGEEGNRQESPQPEPSADHGTVPNVAADDGLLLQGPLRR